MKPSPVALGEGAFRKKKKNTVLKEKVQRLAGLLVFRGLKSQPKNDKIYIYIYIYTHLYTVMIGFYVFVLYI